MSDIDIRELQRWVGRETVATQSLDPFAARALAALLNHDVSPSAGDALPLPWHWLYLLETPLGSRTGEDGHPMRGGFLPPVPLPRRMWAAGAVELDAPLRSMFFVPAHVDRFVASAQRRGADACILDSEDAVPIAQKPLARNRLGPAAAAIHPSQVAPMDEEFSPSAPEIELARAFIAALEPAESEGRGAIEFRAKMVDLPVVLRARELLRRAQPSQQESS